MMYLTRLADVGSLMAINDVFFFSLSYSKVDVIQSDNFCMKKCMHPVYILAFIK